MYETEEKKERVVIFAVATNDAKETLDSLKELRSLIETAGAEVVGQIVQNMEKAVSGTYLGKGKADELRELADANGADSVICDDELSPVQMKNLEEMTGYTVLDRTTVILDIFAQHAKTKEGKIQVELAQLKYRATRLV